MTSTLYSTDLEYCGYNKPRCVARFAGAFLGSFTSHLAAARRCAMHDKSRKAAWHARVPNQVYARTPRPVLGIVT